MKNHSNNQISNQLDLILGQLKTVLKYGIRDCHQVTNETPASTLSKQLDLKLRKYPALDNELISALKTYLHFTPKTNSTKFNKLLFSGQNNPALLADWVTSYSNTTMHTYQVAPVASLMEIELIRKLNKLVGYPDGDGIMVSGGSMANMVAMLLARHKIMPDIKEKGFHGKTLVAYVSELSHYSFEKAITMLGLGLQNLITIRADDQGRMQPQHLKSAIKSSIAQGKQPFFIGLTAGTTVIGSFDAIPLCADIAAQHNLWLHIDGAWGGPILFSKKHRNLLHASNLADSFTWDAHKLLNVPLTAAAIVVKDKQCLESACGGGGNAYLFHADENAEFNLGTKSLACGRRVDSLKFWLSWKAQGSQGFEAKVNYLMQLKDEMVSMINDCPRLKLLAPTRFLNILFRFEPSALLEESQLAQLNIAICKHLHRQDQFFVDYAHYQGKLGIRFILANDQLKARDLQHFLQACLKAGKELRYTIS